LNWFAVSILFFAAAFVMIVVGILLIFIGSLREARRSGERGEVRGGAAVIIGPVPIVIGSDTESVKWLTILAIVLTVVAAVVFILLNFIPVWVKPG